MLTFCKAKINIGLNVIEKRSDGFHNIESVFYPIGLRDVLEVVVSEDKNSSGMELTCTGIPISAEADNLCKKAYYLIMNDYDLPPIKAHLHKIIPIGAGLGGGSSDAAFFIKLINEKFELNISWGEMHHYARQLGSDCSFFITNKPAFAEGRGDQYEPIDVNLTGYHLVLIYPEIFVSTAEAYSGVIPKKPVASLEENILKYPIEEWKNFLFNDFEDHIFKLHPQIKKIKEQLYKEGALYASMSGSGSSVYGIFKEEIDLKDKFPNYFLWQGKL